MPFSIVKVTVQCKDYDHDSIEKNYSRQIIDNEVFQSKVLRVGEFEVEGFQFFSEDVDWVQLAEMQKEYIFEKWGTKVSRLYKSSGR